MKHTFTSIMLLLLVPAMSFAASYNYSVIQGGDTSVDTISYGSDNVVDFYNYAPWSAHTPIGLETSQTAVFFLYEDIDHGVSLGLILDRANDGSGGSAEISFSGFPLGTTRSVADDNGDLNPLVGTSTTDSWNWHSSQTDGTVFSNLAGAWQIDVAFGDLNGIDSALFVTGLNADDTWNAVDVDLADFSIVAAEAPEPGTMALLALAGGAAAFARRRRQNA